MQECLVVQSFLDYATYTASGRFIACVLASPFKILSAHGKLDCQAKAFWFLSDMLQLHRQSMFCCGEYLLLQCPHWHSKVVQSERDGLYIVLFELYV